MFKQCRVSGYVYGNIKRPNPTFNPVGVENWDLNDNYARMLILRISLFLRQYMWDKTLQLIKCGLIKLPDTL